MRCQASKPNTARQTAPRTTSIRWRTENSRIRLTILVRLHFALKHFRFQDEAAVGHDLLAFFQSSEDLYLALVLESEFHDALLKLVCVQRDEHDLTGLLEVEHRIRDNERVLQYISRDL